MDPDEPDDRTPLWPTIPSFGKQRDGQQTRDLRTPATPGEPEPPRRVGRYRVLRELGSGGMGVVYAAHDPDLDRTVALKVLHPELWSGPRADEARARLLREARAMARLSHPNIIDVYDVASADDHAFIAEEFIDGASLREWLKQKPHSWRDVVRLLLQAGRGLAAAHRAGIVHRDFKPDNVLVAKDGRVLVTDFGIARSVPFDGSTNRPALEKLTRAGAAIGTPPYMSPEQHAGQAVDTRSDQFSFCASLYEALYNQRAFLGSSPGEIALSSSARLLRPPPADSRVPARVRRLVLRGLAPRPEERFASMEELLRGLERSVRARWPLGVAAMAVLGALLALTTLAVHHERVRRDCAAQADRWGDVWDDARRTGLQKAFHSSGLPYADDSWPGVQAGLDSYASHWTQSRRSACDLGSWWELDPPPAQALQQACLERRRVDFSALAYLLASGKPALLEHAADAVDRLPPLAPCSAVARLARLPPPPRDAGSQKREAALRERLAQARVQLAAAQFSEGLAALTARGNDAAEEARQLRNPALEAEVQLVDGELQAGLGDTHRAQEALFRAVALGDESGEDEVVAAGWTALSELAAQSLDLEQGKADARLAWGALARLSRQPETEVRLLRSEGLLELYAGHADLAEERFSAALRAAAELFGPKSVSAATAHHGLGLAAAAEGKFERALDEYRQAQSIAGSVLGAGHPSYAGYERNAAYALRFLGRYDESRKAYARSLAALRRALGDDHPAVGVPLYFAGMLEWADDRLDEAEVKIQEARKILSKGYGEGHYDVGLCHLGLAWIHYSRKQPKPALEEAQRAQEIIRKALGSRHVDLGWPLLAEGASHLLEGAPAAAAAPLQQALDLRQNAAEAPVELALIRFELGRALWDSGRDRASAQKLLAAALSSLRQPGRRILAPGYPESLVRELERWWAAHPEVR